MKLMFGFTGEELLIWQDIPKSLRGGPKIQVTFTIDTNGILQAWRTGEGPQ